MTWAKRLVAGTLRDAIACLDEPVRAAAGYHFGWRNEQGGPDSADSGKALRPALVLLCAEAMGVTAARAVEAAAAVELVHNFTLLHDDIMDQDRLRRHRPTVWTVFGVSTAILTGDALLSLGVGLLARHCPRSMERFSSVLVDLCNGQASDIDFERRTEVSVEESLDMVGRKTASLFGFATALGGLVAGSDLGRTEHLRLFGHHLGLAFQLADDISGIWASVSSTGKQECTDIKSRKKTLPVVAALAAGTEAARRLEVLYRGEEPFDDVVVAEVVRLIEQSGGRDWALQRVHAHLAEAVAHLAAADPEPEAARRLAAIPTLIPPGW